MEYYDILFVILELALCVFLWKFSAYCDKYKSSKWKLLWLLPIFILAAIFLVSEADICLITAYIGTAVLMLGFFRDKVNFRRITAVIAAVCIALALPVCMTSKVYRRVDYVSQFEEMLAKAQKRYVLTKHKNIDWQALHDKYLPEFRQATKDRDAAANYIAWRKLCAEFHDGHFCYVAKEDVVNEADRRAWGKDHGLVIMSLADGRRVALNVDDSLEKLGIHQLTEITSWDGMTIEEADDKSDMKHMQSFADIDNEIFYTGVFAAGVGDGTVKVTFIADDGTEKSADLPVIGDYKDRAEACLKKINRSYPIANMEFEQIDSTTACLRICGMSYDSEASHSEDYTVMLRQLKSDLLEMKDSGVKDIIIDIRGNNGGEGGVVKTIATVFSPEGRYFYANNPLWDNEKKEYVLDENGDYIIDSAEEYDGLGLLDGGKIVILVNASSVSAADHLTKVMSQFDNVTVMGFTEPNGSAQGISGIYGDDCLLTVSSSAILDRDGSIFIDSGADRQSGDDLDIKVPFDETAVHELFDEDKDYLLDKAMAVIANN